jgi:DNA-binding MarR family transcriptional regulator
MAHTPEGQLFTDIVLEVFKLNGLLVIEGDQLTKDLGLSSARWKVLGALALSRSQMTVPQIARAMGQTRQSVQRLVNEMRDDGFLVFQVNPHHKRAQLIALTAKGKKIYARLEQKQMPWANAIAARTRASDLKVASSVLKKLIEKLEL